MNEKATPATAPMQTGTQHPPPAPGHDNAAKMAPVALPQGQPSAAPSAAPHVAPKPKA